MKAFEEKLEEILDEYYPIHSFAPEMGEKIRKEAKLALLHLLDEEMPEEKEVKEYHPQWQCDMVHLTHEAKAWNSYRTELRKRLGMR